jgi:hypothetical protein
MDNQNIKRIAALLVACLIWAWAFGWFESGQAKYSDDPAIAALEKERDVVFAKMPEMTEDQRREQGRALQQKASGLTADQRMALFESSMPILVPMFMNRFESEYDKYMEMSPEEQRKELDKRIDEMESRAASGNGGGRGGPRNMDPKKAESIRKKLLDWTTPQQRAKFENGMQIMNNRRKERGLAPMPRPGFF